MSDEVQNMLSLVELQRRKMRRVKRGECPECGTKLFRIGVLGRATPLQNESCQNGRCFICFPETTTNTNNNPNLDPFSSRQKQLSMQQQQQRPPPVPQHILAFHNNHRSDNDDNAQKQQSNNNNMNGGMGFGFFEEDDDVSAITLDQKLVTTAWNHRNAKTTNATNDQDVEQHPLTMMMMITEEKSISSSKMGLEEGSIQERMRQLLVRGDDTETTTNKSHIINNNTTKSRGGVWDTLSQPRRRITVDEKVLPSSLPEAPTVGTNHSPATWMKPNKLSSPQSTFSQNKHNQSKKTSFVAPWQPPILLTEGTGMTPNITIEAPPQQEQQQQHPPTTNTESVHNSTSSHIDQNKHNDDSMNWNEMLKVDPVPSVPVDRTDDNDDDDEDSRDVPERKEGHGSSTEALLDDNYDEEEEVSLELIHEDSTTIYTGKANSSSISMGGNQELRRPSADMVLSKEPSTRTKSPPPEMSLPNSNVIPTINSLHPNYQAAASHQPSEVDQKKDEIQVSPSVPSTANSTRAASLDKEFTVNSCSQSTSPTSQAVQLSEPYEHNDYQSTTTSIQRPKSPPLPPPPTFSRKAPPPSSTTPKPPPPGSAKDGKSRYKDMASSDEVPRLLRALQVGKSHEHADAMMGLTREIYTWGSSAKQQFVSLRGPEVLTSIMWADMMFPIAERAAAELFLAVVTSAASPRSSNNNGAVNVEVSIEEDAMEGMTDALLITMQTLIMDEELQAIGCRVLCCLATSRENDGTRSGACLAVLNALDAHMGSPLVREWGIRALYNQCLYSKHAESNKHTLLTSRLNTSGAYGGQILESMILKSSKGSFQLREGSVLEWACKLCWLLTASGESIARLMSPRIETLRELLFLLEQCRNIQDASVQLQEAVLGMLTNFSRMAPNKPFLCSVDVVYLVLDIMHANKNSVQIQIEACGLMANIVCVLTPQDRDELADRAGAVQTIVGALFAYKNEKDPLPVYALRALAALVVGAEIAKAEVCEPKTFSVLLQCSRIDKTATLAQQEALCNILASLYASDKRQQKALQFDSFEMIAIAMTSYPSSELLHHYACVACRNLSRNEENLVLLLRHDVVRLIVQAMLKFKDSKTIQENSCCILWNISTTEYGLRKIAETPSLACVVATIQNHLESYDVVEMACGTLWSMMYGSLDLQKQFLELDAGADAVACTLVMHPRSTSLLEKSCGILATSCVGAHPRANHVASEAILNVIEAMRNNSKSVDLLQYGTQYIRNVIQQSPDLVGEAEGAISVLIDALKNFASADRFLREACYFIWTISELSKDAKSKILALDGVSIVMAILDRRDIGGIVGNAAMGALNELSVR